MAGWHHWLHGCESEWTLGVSDGQGGLACCYSWGRKELDTIDHLNWTELGCQNFDNVYLRRVKLLNTIYSLPSEKAMAPHCSTLWKIPWMEEPGRLQSMGSLRVRHDWVTSLFTFMHWRRKWQPTPVFLPWESQDGGAWWAAVYWVAQSRTRLKRLSSSSID